MHTPLTKKINRRSTEDNWDKKEFEQMVDDIEFVLSRLEMIEERLAKNSFTPYNVYLETKEDVNRWIRQIKEVLK